MSIESYIPRVKTCWTLLDSSIQIDKLIEKAKEFEFKALCLTDEGNIKAHIEFYKECKKVKIKPILGCELNVRNKDDQLFRLTVIAKNKYGYRNLVSLVSFSNLKENILDGKPSIELEHLHPFKSGLVCLMGDLNSELSHAVFDTWREAYNSSNKTECKKCLKKDWLQAGIQIIKKYKSIINDLLLFRDENALPIIEIINECILEISAKENITSIPWRNTHYLDAEEKEIHEILLRSAVEKIRRPDQSLHELNDYRIFSEPGDWCCLAPKIEGGQETFVLDELCGSYDIRERPILPKFKLGECIVRDPDEYLYKLCRQGFKDRGLDKELKYRPELKEIYGNRVKEELSTFKHIGFSSYFLIMKDIVDFCNSRGMLVDTRGSGTACLTLYLLGVSSVDPLRPDPVLDYSPDRELNFGRFYNLGRMTDEHVSLADVDLDVPPSFREELITYLKDKYGRDNVAHIAAYARFKGRGAIKEVFRLSNMPNYFEISDDITKNMTDESKISDELAEIQEYDPSYGIIRWNIDNNKDIKSAYDEHKDIFEKAIALEKIPKHLSIHAAGIIVADQPLSNLAPLIWSEKAGERLIAIEGSECEDIGLIKIDILGVSALEKCQAIQALINQS